MSSKAPGIAKSVITDYEVPSLETLEEKSSQKRMNKKKRKRRKKQIDFEIGILWRRVLNILTSTSERYGYLQKIEILKEEREKL